jgi:hypothetical protein
MEKEGGRVRESKTGGRFKSVSPGSGGFKRATWSKQNFFGQVHILHIVFAYSAYGKGGFIQKGGGSYGEEGAHILHILHSSAYYFAYSAYCLPYLTN